MSNGISFYPETENNTKFLEQLQVILNREDSSIAECYIAMSTSDMFTVFIYPKKPKYSFSAIAFDFSHDLTDNDAKSGFSANDFKLLNTLFKKYTFSNRFEALFFASKFFQMEDKKSTIYLKFVENVEKNKHLIDDIKVSRHYSLVPREQFLSLVKTSKSVKNSSLIELNTYGFSDTTKEDCLKKIEKLDDDSKKNMIYLEHAKNIETFTRYVVNIYEIDGDTLKLIDINSLQMTT